MCNHCFFFLFVFFFFLTRKETPRKETRNHPSKETNMFTTGYVKIGEGERESLHETNMLLNILVIKQNDE